MGLSPVERNSDSLRIWGSRSRMRRRQSRLGLLTPESRPSVCNASESTLGLEHCQAVPLLHAPPIQSATEAWSRRLAPRRAHATDPGDPKGPVAQGLGLLGRSGQSGTEARTRRLDPAAPRHRSRRPGYGSSNASDGPTGPRHRSRVG